VLSGICLYLLFRDNLLVQLQFDRESFFEIFCGLFRKSSVCFDTGRETPKQTQKILGGFAKQTEKQPKWIEFRCVLVPTEKQICCRGIT
jgi:hypothetical protein